MHQDHGGPLGAAAWSTEPRWHFTVEGTLDGEVVLATWTTYGLSCPPAFRARVERIIDAGLVIHADHALVPATLEHPLGALLTVLRSLSEIHAVELRFADDGSRRN